MAPRAAVVLRSATVCRGSTTVFEAVSLAVSVGEVVAVTGASGSGKTTLLHALAGLTPVVAGEYLLFDVDCTGLADHRWRSLRLATIGLVHQFGELLPELTCAENVALPARLAGSRRSAALERSRSLLEAVGLEGFGDRPAWTLSGGQRQRCAIARALVNEPRLVLADEPTGALDEANSLAVGDLLATLARDSGTAVIIGTHDAQVAAMADRVLHIKAGRLAQRARG